MQSVLTLIAGPDSKPVLPAITSDIAKALPSRPQPDWLAPEIACDLVFEGIDIAATEALARKAVADSAIDILVQPTVGRRKKLLIADMESTIIENEMLDELADFIGLRDQVSDITRRAMNGELDFTEALAARVALLKGLPVSVLGDAAARIRLMPGARELLATMRKAGAHTALVSGGFTVFAEPIAAKLGFDHVKANRLELADGHIAGTVGAPILTRDSKLEALKALSEEYAIPLSDTVAIGDGANDLPMLQAAGLGVAFHAKPAVAAASRSRLNHTDLTGVLYAQGYRQAEIVRP